MLKMITDQSHCLPGFHVMRSFRPLLHGPWRYAFKIPTVQIPGSRQLRHYVLWFSKNFCLTPKLTFQSECQVSLCASVHISSPMWAYWWGAPPRAELVYKTWPTSLGLSWSCFHGAISMLSLLTSLEWGFRGSEHLTAMFIYMTVTDFCIVY